MSQPTKQFAAGKPADAGQLILSRRYRLSMAAIGVNKVGRGLDIGCGNGAQTELFLPNVKELHALDLMPENLAAAAKVLPGVQLHQGVAESLPFPDNHFDLVFTFETIEHVTDDQQSMKEIARVVKPGGWVVMTVPNRWWIFETHGCDFPGVLGKLPWNRAPFIISWLPKSIHDKFAKARIYTRDEISTMAANVGLRTIQHRYVTAPMDVLPIPFLQKLVRATLFRNDATSNPVLATSHFFAFQK